MSGKPLKQKIEGSSNIQVAKLEGNIFVGAIANNQALCEDVDADEVQHLDVVERISDKEAKLLMDLIKSIDALDVAQGRKSERPLMFYIANQAACVDNYKEIPKDKYASALEAVHQHIRTRKIKKMS